MLYFIRHGIQFKIPIGKDAVYDHDLLERQIKESINALQALKDRSPDIEQMRFEKPGQFVVTSRFGQDEITIVPSTITPAEKKKQKLILNPQGDSYVLLVELGSTPGGCAIFAPSGAGESPNGAATVNLALAGWTNVMTTNQDPPGIIDQPTFRALWCNSASVQKDGIEQVKRVDQGYVAYDGDSEAGECTELYDLDNYWTWEGIAYPTHWVNVDPGPPPESFCGYTWAPWPIYGGSAADFHDEAHLFYGVATPGGAGGDHLIAWWPPEFNQKLTINQRWNVEGCAYPSIFDATFPWDDIETQGVRAGADGLYCTNTVTEVSALYDDSKRIWGLLWGNTTFYAEDRGDATFPYKNYSQLQQLQYSIFSDYKRTFPGDHGVYVWENYDKWFIEGIARNSPADDLGGTTLRRITKREEIIESEAFVPEGYPRDPLTARQLELIEGNEGAYAYVYDSFRDLWIFEESVTTDPTPEDYYINCGGDEFLVREGAANIEAEFTDYGIFTKRGKGITDAGRVDPATIDPVYAYAMAVYLDSGGGSFDPSGIIYGMVIDGKHYRTEEYPFNGTNADISGLTAYDVNQSPILPMPKVRIGVRRINLTQEIEFD